MLKKLFGKLHVFLTGIFILIITLILCFSFWNSYQARQMGEVVYIQRMAALITYQLEDDETDPAEVLSDYEAGTGIYSLLKNARQEMVYKTRGKTKTDVEKLFARAGQTGVTQSGNGELSNARTSEQGGYVEISGDGHDRYYGIMSVITTKKGVNYSLALFSDKTTAWDLFLRELPLYGGIWCACGVFIFFAGRLLLAKAFEPTEKVLKSQKNFVAAASHELKSPLAVIMANAENLQDHLEDENEVLSPQMLKETLKNGLGTIDHECCRMSKLVQDMLFLASSDAGQWKLEKQQVNVDTLLISLYEAFEPVCAERSIRLELEISEESYPALYTDRERLFQILSVYMDNAAAYSFEGSSIGVQAKAEGKNITFFVEDHGKGIKDQDKPFIFDRFYCADRSRTDKSHFGLGLSIARELGKMLGGEIGFFDTPGGGATFYVTLPMDGGK